MEASLADTDLEQVKRWRDTKLLQLARSDRGGVIPAEAAFPPCWLLPSADHSTAVSLTDGRPVKTDNGHRGAVAEAVPFRRAQHSDDSRSTRFRRRLPPSSKNSE